MIEPRNGLKIVCIESRDVAVGQKGTLYKDKTAPYRWFVEFNESVNGHNAHGQGKSFCCLFYYNNNHNEYGNFICTDRWCICGLGPAYNWRKI